MIYCNDCGAITDGKVRAEQIDGFFREYVVCEYCGSDNVSDAVKCQVCGEWKQDDLSDTCERCSDKIYNEFVGVKERIEEEYPDANHNDVLEAMAHEFERFYDKYF